MDFETLRIERPAEAVARIVLSRPNALNAVSLQMALELRQAMREVEMDGALRALIVTGEGKAFCAGGDVTGFHASLPAPEQLIKDIVLPLHDAVAIMTHMDKPVIAAVNGIAAGAGASIAFLADVRLVAASAGFNLAFAQVGLSCDTGCSWTLPRLVGPAAALRLLYFGGTISAEESLRLGIATEVVADAEFEERVHDLAGTLAVGPTQAYAAMRHSVAYASHHSLADALAVEADMMARTGATEDHQQAVDAFLAKRPAIFTGQRE